MAFFGIRLGSSVHASTIYGLKRTLSDKYNQTAAKSKEGQGRPSFTMLLHPLSPHTFQLPYTVTRHPKLRKYALINQPSGFRQNSLDFCTINDKVRFLLDRQVLQPFSHNQSPNKASIILYCDPKSSSGATYMSWR